MDEDKPGRTEKVVRTVWDGLGNLPVSPANRVVSQFVQDMFVVSFGLFVQPPLIGPEEERKKQLEEWPDTLPIRPIVRLSLTPDRLEQVIDVLQENLANYRQRQAQSSEEE